MLISTERGTAQVVSPNADTRFYDDIACLAADWPAHGGDQAIAYVRTSDGVWRKVHDASYAHRTEAQTAMGSGLGAYATIAEARAADRDGGVLRWDEVVNGIGERR
jgi:hypothetical protein